MRKEENQKTIHEEAGLDPERWEVIDRPAINPELPAGGPPSIFGRDPYGSSVLPLNFGYQPDLIKTDYGISSGIPQYRLMPIAGPPIGGTQSFSQATSHAANNTANTANSTANAAAAVTKSTPIAQMAAAGTVDSTQPYFSSKGGTIVPQVVGTTASIVTYTSTVNSANITWPNFTVFYGDDTTTSVIGGSQSITGLVSSTIYYLYPYLDANNNMIFTTVAGGVGIPPILYTPKSPTAAQAQNLQNVTPISSGGIQVITPSSGGGGGGGGGSGICVRDDSVVLHKEKGIVKLLDCEVGDWIKGQLDWTQIIRKRILPQNHFIKFIVEGESIEVTPSHQMPLGGEDDREAKDVSISSFLIVEKGFAPIKSIEHIEEDGQKITVSCEPEHVFFAGKVKPIILVHNLSNC